MSLFEIFPIVVVLLLLAFASTFFYAKDVLESETPIKDKVVKQVHYLLLWCGFGGFVAILGLISILLFVSSLVIASGSLVLFPA